MGWVARNGGEGAEDADDLPAFRPPRHLWHPWAARLSTTLSPEPWLVLVRRTGMNTTRMPHVPSAPLPELAEFLAPFRVHFHRSEGPQTLERYLAGLLTEHPNTNCDTLAQVVPGTSEQRLQGLLTS